MPVSGQFPRAFGKYTLLEPLAQGGMGALYIACLGEEGMEKLCVVKTVLKELADKEYLARFRDEAKVVVRLAHGNLVPVFDAGTVAGELYVGMEYIDGKDLRAVWNRCAKKGIAFPVDVAAHVAREMARGLYYAHTFGELKLVHRDISPPNVLLAFSGEVKLTDFGLASSTLKMERTAPGVIYGKVSYMSPEQARGDSLDGRTDLYATGIILWELLTGRQLFPSSDPEVLEKVRSPKIEPPSTRAARVPVGLDAIVMKALATDKNDRYADGEAFRRELAEFLAREAPATDASRIAGFLGDLFGNEIDEERRRRQELIERARGLVRVRRHTDRSLAPPAGATSDPAGAASEAATDRAANEAATDEEVDDRSSRIVGTTIDGRYRIDRMIGEGGMGRVYEAEHIEIGKRVAIKVLHPVYSRNPEAVLRFRREARAAARLGHPNIVDVTDSGTTGAGAVYFVMEFLEGSDLADLISREGAISVERTIHIGVQTCRALAAAHDASIIHRDLKPENIFLISRAGQSDIVKVLDFGIARQIEMEEQQPGKRLTNPGMAMGTPEYMAPEQAAGKPADARSDVFAVGAILYEMLCSTPPHTGSNFMEVLSKKANEIPAPLSSQRSDVPASMSDLIAATLAKDPALRPQSMNDFAVALERCRPDRRGMARSQTQEVRPINSGSGPADAASDQELAALLGGAATRRRLLYIGIPVGVVVLLAALALLRRPAEPPRTETPTVAPTSLAPRREPTDPGTARPAPRVEVAPESGRPPPITSLPPSLREHHAPGLREAQKLLAGGRADEAEKILQRLVAAPGPDRAAAGVSLGRLAFQRGNFAEAIRQGKRSLQAGGGLAAQLLLGNAYLRNAQYGDAIEQYRAVLKAQPEHREAKQNLEAAQRRAGG